MSKSCETAQTEFVPGREDQVKNQSGGAVFQIDAFGYLDRFLVLGSASGKFNAAIQKTPSKDSSEAVFRCLKADGLRTVARIVEVSEQGRAPKNDSAIFALAVCLKNGDEATKRAAVEAVPKVCRIGTHIFDFASAVQSLGGWGRSTKRAFDRWYTGQSANDLAHNLVKYQNRNGWSNWDVLYKAHVKPTTDEQKELFKWATGKLHSQATVLRGEDGKDKTRWVENEDAKNSWLSAPVPESALRIVWAFEKAKQAKDASEIVRLITEFRLPRECVPTEFLNDKNVWAALLDNGGKGMPITGLIRNLAKMTAVGLIEAGSDAEKKVSTYLLDIDRLKKGRVHPFSVLLALRTYAQGRGEKGSLTWTPSRKVVDMLDAAYYLAFQGVEPTGRATMLCHDVSGSMQGATLFGTPITAREASGAMAMVTAQLEDNCHFMAFDHTFRSLPIKRDMRLDKVTQILASQSFGSTDCSLPMQYALKNKIPVEVFQVYTDNETYAGNIQPFQALRKYREAMGIRAKLVVVGLCASDFTIADPTDAGMLDVVGFDSAAPQVIADFARS